MPPTRWTDMGGVSKKHLVDRRWVTVKEIAAEMGLKPQQLYHQMHVHRCGLQSVVNMILENQILNGQASSSRWMVDGKWTTINQAAEALGVTHYTVYNYMYNHKLTLQEAVDAIRAGKLRHGGHDPVRHNVHGKAMTTFEAAEALGVSVNAVRLYMHKHKCSLAATIRHYEQRKRKKAEKDILAILMEGKR